MLCKKKKNKKINKYLSKNIYNYKFKLKNVKTARVLVVCVCVQVLVYVQEIQVQSRSLISVRFRFYLSLSENETHVVAFECVLISYFSSAPFRVFSCVHQYQCAVNRGFHFSLPFMQKKKTESKLHFASFSRSLSPLMYLPYYRAFPSPPSSSSPPPLLWKTVSVV